MDFKGLSTSEVEESRRKNGSNKLPEAEPTTFFKEFVESFKDPMIIMLLCIAGLTLVMFFFGYSEIYDPVGIIVTVCIVAAVTAKTNVSSDAKFRALKKSVKKDRCKVYRNGSVQEIEFDDVVVGDYVLLQAGNKIPADAILIKGHLTVDNSALNGEAEECHKNETSIDTAFPENLTGDTFVDESSLFRGSVVFDGEGVCHVRKVGVDTVSGKMALEMQEKDPDSPLKVKLAKLADQISLLGKIGALAIAVMYLVSTINSLGGIDVFVSQGITDILKQVMNAISLAAVIIVCAVPEGLPLMIALVLMQNTSRMLDHNVLVRKAIGIETAGSLNILFSDKTGTITKGKLQVVEFFTGDGKTVEMGSDGFVDTLSTEVALSIAMTAESMYDSEHNVIGGNATDQAMLKFLGETAYNKYRDPMGYRIVENQRFNSTNKFCQAYVSGANKTYYKGAPEKLTQAALKYLGEDGVKHPLDQDVIREKIDSLAGEAKRVLALAYSPSEMTEDGINDDTVIIGYVAIRDDVRPEAVTAIRDVHRAGVQVVMITGDRLETAKAIAKDADLLHDGEMALTSAELNAMSDEEVKELIPKIRVIARALPTDKSRMVRLCQEMNLVVGMTGDGVNDSPALKRADVGFAMGSGTDAAKEAGKIVILDDNFKSIKDAILYGRTIYHNILKFCTFQLVINVAAVFVSAFSPFFGIVEPLKVTHLLFVNLVMDGLGAMMLGNEPAKEEYMRESPRRRDEAIVSNTMLWNIISTAMYLVIASFVYLKLPLFRNMFDSSEAHLTGYFVFFIASALFNGFNVRDAKYAIFDGLDLNKSFIKIQLIIIGVQLLIVNAARIPMVPFQWIGHMFGCTPFGLSELAVILIMASLIVPVNLIWKALNTTSAANQK